MQTYNSFNELAAAQCASPLVSSMSVFNAGAMSDSVAKWFKKEHPTDPDKDSVKDITFEALLKQVQSGVRVDDALGVNDSDVRLMITEELSNRSGVPFETLDGVRFGNKFKSPEYLAAKSDFQKLMDSNPSDEQLQAAFANLMSLL